MSAMRLAHPPHHPTVPDALLGCWRRAWIEFADGRRDDTSVVVWLQLATDMADVRLPGGTSPLRDREGFDDCSVDELRSLATSESSTGFTRCSPVAVDADGVRRATADWFSGDDAVAFQPITAFPEPGLLAWQSDDVLIERAPSGAYVEEWRRLPGTRHPLEHRADGAGRHLYRAGDAAVIVRDRPVPLTRIARLDELIVECGDDRAALTAIVDCEFSFARRHGDRYLIEASTLPWREGSVVDVDLR